MFVCGVWCVLPVPVLVAPGRVFIFLVYLILIQIVLHRLQEAKKLGITQTVQLNFLLSQFYQVLHQQTHVDKTTSLIR